MVQRWKKWKQIFEFYFSASGTEDGSQMRALLLHGTGPDVQDIFMHLEEVGTTYKAALGALNNHFECYIINTHISSSHSRSERTVDKFCHKLASTCEFANQNTEIEIS